MAEFSEYKFDARVLREAKSLAKCGYNVKMILYSEYIDQKQSKKNGNLTVILYPFAEIKLNQNFIQRWQRNITALKIIMNIWGQILKSRDSYFHMHNLYFLIPAYLKSLISNAKIVYDAHELHSEHHNMDTLKGRVINKFLSYYEKFFMNRVDAVIQASEERADFISSSYSIRRPYVINNYTPMEEWKKDKIFHNELNLPKNAKVMLYIGGIYKSGSRRIDKILEIIPQIQINNFYFIIIGFMNSKVKQYLDEKIEKLEICDKIRILPPVELTRVVEMAAAADVGIIPLSGDSINTKYSALNKISEYLMAGLPIACTNYTNLNDIIYNNSVGQVGETFELTSPGSIVRAIESILTSDKKLSLNARNLAEKKLNWEKEDKKLSAIYETI